MSGLYVHVDHEAHCPEVDPVTCAQGEVPEHRHLQDIGWVRLDPTLSVGLGRGWQVAGELPVDLRAVRVDYVTLDGAPFDPPYDDIHHRDETLFGVVDGQVRLSRYQRAGGATLGLGLGTTVPLGRTEEDPYALGEAGKTHQHLQFGTGTFVPLARAEGWIGHRRWGALAQLEGAWSLYANGKGYRAPSRASLTAGPTWRATPALTVWALPQVGLETPERWSGEPYGGVVRAYLGVGGAAPVAPGLSLTAEARVLLAQAPLVPDPEGVLVQPLLLSVGGRWAPTRGGPDGDPPGGPDAAAAPSERP